MEKESLQRTRVFRPPEEDERSCFSCGKPLIYREHRSVRHDYIQSHVEGGVSARVNPTNDYGGCRIVICDDCLRDLVDRTAPTEIVYTD